MVHAKMIAYYNAGASFWEGGKRGAARETRRSRTLATGQRPLTAENEIVVTPAVDLLPCAVGIFPVLEADESVTLANTSFAVAADVDTHHTTKAAEEFPEVVVIGVFAEIGNTEGGEVVSGHTAAEAAHLLAGALGTATHAGWDVLAACTCSNGRVGGVHGGKRGHGTIASLGSVCASTRDGLECVLVGTFCGEVVSLAKSANDTLVGELLSHLVHVINFGLGSLVASIHLENNVFTDGGGGRVRAGGLALLLTELGPVLAFCDLVVDLGLDKCPLDPSGDLTCDSTGNRSKAVSCSL